MRFSDYFKKNTLLPFFPVFQDLQQSNLVTLRQDLLAGLAVAMLTIPQTMAFSMVAGLPMSCGVYAAIFSAFLAAAFSSSRHLIVGPSNTIAILIQAGTAEILYTYYRDLVGPERQMMAVNILMQLSLLIGLFQVIGGSFKLGRLTHFVSHSVIVGYLVGVACAVAITQAYVLVGIPTVAEHHSVYEKAIYLFTHIPLVDPPTAVIGILSIMLLLAFQRTDRRLPGGLIVGLLISLAVWVEGWLAQGGFFGLFDPLTPDVVKQVQLVGDTGILDSFSLNIAFPFFDLRIMNAVVPFAFAVALLSVLESTAVARSIAVSTGQRLYVNQDVFSLGVGNLVSSFVGAMPISGSPSRTSMNFRMGAQTRFAAMSGAIFVGIFVIAFQSFIAIIPLAFLGALILVTTCSIVDTKQLSLCMRATGSDAFVLMTTILACLFFNLDTAFYIGIILSIMLYLKKAAAPHIVEFNIAQDGTLCKLDSRLGRESKKVRFIKVEGELFFGAADIFQSTLQALAKDDAAAKVIILQMKNARDMDATACLALQQLNSYLKKSGRYLLVCGFTRSVEDVLKDSGLAEEIGKENLFGFDERFPTHYMQKALQRSKVLSEETITQTVAFLPEVSSTVLLEDSMQIPST